MTDFVNIIADYQRRCTQLLQGAIPNSDEHMAYSHILQAFNQNQTGEAADRSFRIAQALAFEANSIEVLPLAPREDHARATRVRAIVTQWANNFKQDTGHSGVTFKFMRR